MKGEKKEQRKMRVGGRIRHGEDDDDVEKKKPDLKIGSPVPASQKSK